ncbi:hypothetical protein [Methylobacterium terrae]|uniref:hypothetical protein n=1 Tax=Methylobacterium terrae TaxID=2202827 RepID=UPI0013A59107|nr:hypothetical protein [Methylobacterium terrae]
MTTGLLNANLKNMTSLIVVGNAPVENNHESLVDTADCVVRFNKCENYGKNTGTKTDILVLGNLGAHSLDWSKDNKLSSFPFWREISEIWFPRDRDIYIKYRDIYTNKIIDQAPPGPINDYKNHIIAGNKISAEIICLPKEVNEFSFLLLSCLCDNPFSMPSTGFLTLMYILTCERFSNYKIGLIGFGFSGWDGHPWSAEREAVAKFEASGQVIRY